MLTIEEGENEEDDEGSKGDEESELEGSGEVDEEENLEEERRDDDPQDAMQARTKGGEGLGATPGDDTASLQQLCM